MAKRGRKPDVLGDHIPDDWRDQFLERMANGRSTIDVCRDEDMPHRDYVRKLRDRDPDFNAKYMRAVDHRADKMFDEIISIADKSMIDKRTKVKSDGSTEVIHMDNVDRARLRVDARKWSLARMSPNKYGDRVSVDASVKSAPLTDEEQLEQVEKNLPLLIPMLEKLGYFVIKMADD